MAKNKIIIKRGKCIGCGSCVACSDGRINFIDGKAWSDDVDYKDDEIKELIDICPVEAIYAGDDEEYQKEKQDQKVDD